MVSPMEIPVETRRCLWLQWVVANALGLAAGMALFGILDDTAGEMGDTGDASAHLGGLPLAATVFVVCQWLILRRYAQRMRRAGHTTELPQKKWHDCSRSGPDSSARGR